MTAVTCSGSRAAAECPFPSHNRAVQTGLAHSATAHPAPGQGGINAARPAHRKCVCAAHCHMQVAHSCDESAHWQNALRFQNAHGALAQPSLRHSVPPRLAHGHAARQGKDVGCCIRGAQAPSCDTWDEKLRCHSRRQQAMHSPIRPAGKLTGGCRRPEARRQAGPLSRDSGSSIGSSPPLPSARLQSVILVWFMRLLLWRTQRGSPPPSGCVIFSVTSCSVTCGGQLRRVTLLSKGQPSRWGRAARQGDQACGRHSPARPPPPAPTAPPQRACPPARALALPPSRSWSACSSLQGG